MATYGFRCPECDVETERKIPMDEYDKEKNNQFCETCGTQLRRTISRPVMKLEGGGWFDQDYSITQQEMNQNLEMEKRMEQEAPEMQYQDTKRKEY